MIFDAVQAKSIMYEVRLDGKKVQYPLIADDTEGTVSYAKRDENGLLIFDEDGKLKVFSRQGRVEIVRVRGWDLYPPREH